MRDCAASFKKSEARDRLEFPGILAGFLEAGNPDVAALPLSRKRGITAEPNKRRPKREYRDE